MSDQPFPAIPLRDLGPRIMVMGPSNAGKSTLAHALGQELGHNVVHLDQMRFLPDTDWQERSDAAFKDLHDRAIRADSWIMDGNYSALLPPRLARATGVILLQSATARRFLRYLNRTVLTRAQRIGALEGAKDSLKWEMVDWILIRTRHSAVRYEAMIRASDLPFVYCKTAKQLDQLYQAWGVERPR